MDKIAEDLSVGRIEQYSTDYFHNYLLGDRDFPPELLPMTINLSSYTARINEMYNTQIIRGTQQDYSIPLEQRLEQPKEVPVAGERGCSSYYDPTTQTVQFTPIIHGTEGSVTREAFDLLRQGKLPIVEIHTHPEGDLFSPEDYVTLLLKAGTRRFMKAALLLCPSNQVLALASSETAKYDQSELAMQLVEWHKLHDTEMDQVAKTTLDKNTINFARFDRTFARLSKLAATGKFTQSRLNKAAENVLQKTKTQMFKDDPIDQANLMQKQNQGLLRFALSNGIKLYFSTDRSSFREFSA